MKKRDIFIVIVCICIGLACFCAPDKKEDSFDTRARAIHDRILTVDTHCDTPIWLVRGDYDIGQRHPTGQRTNRKIDLPRMAEGGLDAQFFAAYVGQGERTPQGYERAYNVVSRLIDTIEAMCRNYPDLVELAVTPDDAYRLEREGKRAAFIGIENGYAIGKDLSLIKEFFDRGVRYITLCHSSDNDICDSSTDRQDPEDRGLSEFGKQVVAECNRLGIIVDVSHISDKSFFDVLEISKAPVIASHSCVRALCDQPRNLSDKMIDALAEKGGVLQIAFVSDYIKDIPLNPERERVVSELRKKYREAQKKGEEEILKKLHAEYEKIDEKYPTERATLKELVDHIDYMVKRVGAKYVGIGTDFDGGGDIDGIEDVSQMSKLTEELLRRGYEEEDIRLIWGENTMRVLREVMETAERIQSQKEQE